MKDVLAALALAAMALPAATPSLAQAGAQPFDGERLSKGIEAYNAAPQTYWVFVRDKAGIVALYPPEGKTVDGRTWATTNQFEELISAPVDPSAGPTVMILNGMSGRAGRPSCIGPFCPGDTVLQRLQGMPDFPAGNLVLKGTADRAAFFEQQ